LRDSVVICLRRGTSLKALLVTCEGVEEPSSTSTENGLGLALEPPLRGVTGSVRSLRSMEELLICFSGGRWSLDGDSSIMRAFEWRRAEAGGDPAGKAGTSPLPRASRDSRSMEEETADLVEERDEMERAAIPVRPFML